jgi:hypothetical protein
LDAALQLVSGAVWDGYYIILAVSPLIALLVMSPLQQRHALYWTWLFILLYYMAGILWIFGAERERPGAVTDILPAILPLFSMILNFIFQLVSKPLMETTRYLSAKSVLRLSVVIGSAVTVMQISLETQHRNFPTLELELLWFLYLLSLMSSTALFTLLKCTKAAPASQLVKYYSRFLKGYCVLWLSSYVLLPMF